MESVALTIARKADAVASVEPMSTKAATEKAAPAVLLQKKTGDSTAARKQEPVFLLGATAHAAASGMMAEREVRAAWWWKMRVVLPKDVRKGQNRQAEEVLKVLLPAVAARAARRMKAMYLRNQVRLARPAAVAWRVKEILRA